MDNKISWVDEIYKYGEALFWEPQMINRQANKQDKSKITPEDVFNKLRRWEVSLNIPFNILMRLLPSQIKKDILNIFFKDNVELENIKSVNFYGIMGDMDGLTQPDVTLSSENSNIFIELKINATLTLQQITKYLLAHLFWKEKEGNAKKSYLLLLGKDSLSKQWDAKERKLIFDDKSNDILNLYNYLIKRDILDYKEDLKGQYKNLIPENELKFKPICENVIIGWSSWKEVGNLLKNKSNGLDPIKDETVKMLIDDFLDELKVRKLWELES